MSFNSFFFLHRFGDDIPGMEGLGTGELLKCISRQFLWFAVSQTASHIVVLLQTSPSFALGRPSITWSCMSWPSTASFELFHIPLQSSGDYRPHPCTSNHLPQAPAPRFKMELFTTTCNKHKNGKREKKNLQKKKRKLSVIFPWTLLLTLQLTFRIFWFESHH